MAVISSNTEQNFSFFNRIFFVYDDQRNQKRKKKELQAISRKNIYIFKNIYMYRVFPLQVKMLIVSDGDNGEIFLKQVKLLLLSIIHQQHANVFWVRHNALKNNFKISANYKFFVKSISWKNSWNQFHEIIREINYTKNFALFLWVKHCGIHATSTTRYFTTHLFALSLPASHSDSHILPTSLSFYKGNEKRFQS